MASEVYLRDSQEYISVKSDSEFMHFNLGADIKNVAFNLSVILSQPQLWKYNIAYLQWVQLEQDR